MTVSAHSCCTLQGVAEAMAAGLDVRLRQEVVGIACGGSGVRVACKNGEVFDADAAIVTVSIGVLKVHRVLLQSRRRARKGVHWH